MTERHGTDEPGGADEVAAAHDALVARREDGDEAHSSPRTAPVEPE